MKKLTYYLFVFSRILKITMHRYIRVHGMILSRKVFFSFANGKDRLAIKKFDKNEVDEVFQCAYFPKIFTEHSYTITIYKSCVRTSGISGSEGRTVSLG